MVVVKLLSAAAFAVCLAGEAQASPHMRITPCVIGIDYHECAIIQIDGEILSGDGEEFLERTKDIKDAVVSLNSPGGRLVDGIMIGERIHERQFETVVGADAMCHSACAAIWLAGSAAHSIQNPNISFHSPYLESTPDASDAPGVAYMGAYLGRLGMTPDVVIRLFGKTPNDIIFLGRENGMLTVSPPIRMKPKMKTVEENIYTKYLPEKQQNQPRRQQILEENQ